MSVVWYKIFPAEFGGQKGIADFNKALAGHFNLVCVCSINNESSESFPVFNFLPVSKLQFINPVVILKLVKFAKQQKVTHIILEHPYHAVAGWLLKKMGVKIITHSHNIEYLRFKQMGKSFWPLLKFVERWTYN